MRTLMVHPKDATTDFLKPIYESIPNMTLLNHIPNDRLFINQVSFHDRVVFMGHGTEKGMAFADGFTIDERFSKILSEKENVYIWCNADGFVKKHNLKGFYTGMIISDWIEAAYESVTCQYQEIDESNELFTKAISAGICKPNMLDIVKEIYVEDGLNRVIQFNRQNLYET